MSGIRLSHSSKDTYISCPQKWKLHYINKYRSRRTTSALVFGSAIDSALNDLLLSGNYAQAEMIFTDEWLTYKNADHIDFYPSDYDSSLLTLQDVEAIEAIADDTKRKHALAWHTLLVKGIVMLRAYHVDIYPRIKKVHSVQTPVNLIGMLEDGTESADSISGFIDCVVDLELDNKTSGTPYPKNAVLTKEQTALYSLAYPDIEYAAFAVMVKKSLGRTQLLIGKPPEELKQKVLDNFVSVLDSINEGKFPQNRKSCYAFGSKCVYYSYCHGEGFDENIYEKCD
jgi:PD-(D/E)XK nuclease superfamily